MPTKWSELAVESFFLQQKQAYMVFEIAEVLLSIDFSHVLL